MYESRFQTSSTKDATEPSVVTMDKQGVRRLVCITGVGTGEIVKVMVASSTTR
jgi:uncharacterized metal-binding protein